MFPCSLTFLKGTVMDRHLEVFCCLRGQTSLPHLRSWPRAYMGIRAPDFCCTQKFERPLSSLHH